MTAMVDDLVLRAATAADLPVLTALNQQLVADQGHDNPIGPAELESRMRTWLSGVYSVSLIESDGSPVAYAVWREDDDGVCLRQFFVVRMRRRLRIGSRAFALLRRRWASGEVRLNVLVHNEASLAFWHSLGFRDYGLILRYQPENLAEHSIRRDA